MRLTSQEIEAIRLSAQKAFADPVEIYLFGSRVDDRLKGGDIDLLVIGRDESSAKFLNKFLIGIEEKIGEQKIDAVFRTRNTIDDFVKSALTQAVKIWETRS